MDKIELLSPAGDLERLKVTLLYGADAVYIGGKKYSLRANATNFDLDEIKELRTDNQQLPMLNKIKLKDNKQLNTPETRTNKNCI